MTAARRSAAAARKAAAIARLAEHPFRPAWWLPGGRQQTLVSAVLPTRARARLRLERWPTPDDDFLRLHLADGRADLPALLVLHGLEGSVRARYVTRLAELAAARGWGAAVLEYRTCGGEMNRARRTYHIGETGDVGFVVGELCRRWPGRRLYPVGFSFGASLLLKWLGEQGDDAPAEVEAAAAVSPPFDLRASVEHVDRELGGAMARVFLRTMIPKALAKARQYPGSIDVEAARRSRTFREFDEAVTAPLHGFRDAEHYWAESDSGRLLDRVRRSTLLIASRDDPLNPASTLPHAAVERSPFLVPLWTDRGGHSAFISSGLPWRAERWAEAQIMRFFELCEERSPRPAEPRERSTGSADPR